MKNNLVDKEVCLLKCDYKCEEDNCYWKCASSCYEGITSQQN